MAGLAPHLPLHAYSPLIPRPRVSSQGFAGSVSAGAQRRRDARSAAGAAALVVVEMGRRAAIAAVAHCEAGSSGGEKPHRSVRARRQVGDGDGSRHGGRGGGEADGARGRGLPPPEAGDGGGGDGRNGKLGGGGHGNSDDENDRGDGGDDLGPLLSAEEVSRQARERGITLPSDMLEAAITAGLPSHILSRYMDLQGSGWPLGAAIQGSKRLRNRMLADESFLFKLFTEVAIDASCATFAEVQKRGKDFWNEFELFMADLLVGVVLDIALVCMLAPFVRLGKRVPGHGKMTNISQAIQALPSSIFEAESTGRRFSMQQRVGTYFYKGAQYGALGFSCGIIGQGIANCMMIMKRKLKKSEGQDVPVPPLLQSAVLWCGFLAISSNTRYQIVNGLERVVEGSSVARRLPPVAMAFTIGIRFANNIYGGMQFVDWARWAGVQ